jgi:sugar lactone lactonase YvrE
MRFQSLLRTPQLLRRAPLRHPLGANRALLLLALALGLLSGCATKPVAKKTYTFFPPKPDEPHIQYLATYSSDADLGASSKFAEFVTGKSKQENPIVKPYGVGIHNGQLFVCDTMRNAIEIYDLPKKQARYFAAAGDGAVKMPINITIDPDDTRYVADTTRGQVLVYKGDDFVSALGNKEEMAPCDVLSTSNRLYVADIKSHIIRVYNKPDLKPLFTIPRDKTGTNRLFSPTNLAMDPQGRLLISDTGAFAVFIYDAEGNYISSIGQHGDTLGSFARPKGVACDRHGYVYVADAAAQVVQVFNLEGKLLMFFGEPEHSPEGDLHLPAAVRIDYDNVALFQDKVAPGFRCEYLILVTSQIGPNKVNVYGFVSKK